MSAAIQLVSPQIIHAEKTMAEIESFASGSAEQRLRRATDYINELQAEIRTLHSELARAERALRHRDTLLRNAIIREQELRAELVKGAF
jgi:multidrug resistance efflux pump